MQSPNHRPGKLESDPNMLSANKLSQHAVSQLKAREARHTIPACSSIHKLSQHAVGQLKAREARHTIPAHSRSQLWHGKARHAIPAYTVQAHYPSIHCEKLTCIKEAVKARRMDKLKQQEPEQQEQQSKQPQHLGRLGKRHEA